MKNNRLYFLFYKRVFAFPLAVAVFSLISSEKLAASTLILLVATLVVWAYEKFISDPKREKFYFYLNLGKSVLNLYSFCFLTNFFILIILYFFIK